MDCRSSVCPARAQSGALNARMSLALGQVGLVERGGVYGQNGVDLSFSLCFACEHTGTLLSNPSFC